jgi:cyanophycin synthetase
MTHIRFREIRHLCGPNRWTYRPVLQAIVDIGELEDYPSNTIPGYYERLKTLLPSLVEHRCSYGERGGFLRRVEEGTWPAHILEHVTLELQNLAGLPGGFGTARETAERGVYTVVVRAWQEQVTRAALHEARELILAAMENRPFNVAAAIGRLADLADSCCLSPSTASIVEAAAERGIPAIRLLETGNLVQLGYGAAMRRIWAAETDRTGAIAEGIARDEALSRSLLRDCGVPVPDVREAGSAGDAWDAALDLGLPVRLRPADGDRGRGAFDLDTREDIETAYGAVAGEDGAVWVERRIPGTGHRLLVIGGKLAAASRRDGDTGHEIDVTGEVHPETAEIAVLAARVVGLDIAGVDLVCGDISRPLGEQGGAVVGVKAGPGLLAHLEPGAGRPQPVGRAIVEHLFPDGAGGRIPLVGVSGSHGTTVVARLVARLLTLSGKCTGLSCGDGLFIDRRRLEKGDCAHWEHARRLLMNRAVEAAVFENGIEAIATEGLAYDRCRVGVLTRFDASRHIGRNHLDTPEHVFDVLRTQVDLVLADGAAVLDAEDAALVKMAGLCDGEVIYFARDPSLPVVAAHLEQGRRAVVVRCGWIMLASGADEIPLAKLEDVSLAKGGDAEWNVLAAVGAAWALGIPPDLMRTGIETEDRRLRTEDRALATLALWSVVSNQ